MPTTITREQIEAKIIEALATFVDDAEVIEPSATLESLDVDSLDLAELSQIVEDEYGVGLKSSDTEKIKTVSDAVDVIASRL
jgi:acyl carrier protein